MKRLLLNILLIIGFNISPKAQDLIGGEITYSYISGYNYSIRLALYTRTSANIDRDSIILNWGDGSAYDTISSIKQILPNDITQYIISKNHVYPGSGIYLISFIDSFRIPDINNIQNSEAESFYLETELIVNFLGVNNSSISSNVIIDTAFKGVFYQNNFGFADPDGDSLQFELIPSNNNYFLPPGLSVEPSGGMITWDTPDTIGIYIIAVRAIEFRNGLKTGSVDREIMIQVVAPNNIDDKKESDIVSIYPNPTSENITILSGVESIYYEIYNIAGRRLKRDNIISLKQTIPLKQYQAGIYYLKISVDEKIYLKKVIKE